MGCRQGGSSRPCAQCAYLNRYVTDTDALLTGWQAVRFYLASRPRPRQSYSSPSSSSSFVLGWGSRRFARMEEANDVSFPRIMRKTDDEDEDDWDITLNINRYLAGLARPVWITYGHFACVLKNSQRPPATSPLYPRRHTRTGGCF
jgi:hypothetical protein